jgi:hypothetical protein
MKVTKKIDSNVIYKKNYTVDVLYDNMLFFSFSKVPFYGAASDISHMVHQIFIPSISHQLKNNRNNTAFSVPDIIHTQDDPLILTQANMADDSHIDHGLSQSAPSL